MTDRILGKNEVAVYPKWGDGSTTACVWAGQQRCPSPLAKLILLRMCDCTGMSAEWGVWVGVLAEWCGASCEEVAEAVDALGKAGLVHVWINDNLIHLTLPWWQEPEYVRTVPVKATLRRQLWDDQNGNCWYCGCQLSCDHLRIDDGSGALVDPEGHATCEIEHQHPRSRGGSGERSNLVLACKPCNRTKFDRTVDEYRDYLSSRVGAAVVFHGERER